MTVVPYFVIQNGGDIVHLASKGAPLGCLIRVCSLVGVVSWGIGHQNGGVSWCVILRTLTSK